MNAPETAAARPLCLWMTRTAEDAEASASPVRALGHHVMVEPLMTIERLEGPPLDLTGVQALLATSANGVRAFAARQPERSLPLLAVGDATARAAAAAGFQQVESAAGDVQALAELVRSRLDPAAGALLHIAASKRAGDLAGALSAAGFTCRRAVLYRARAAEALSGELAAMIREGRLDGALVFSPRTAATLARLLRQEKLADAAASMDLYCLSEAVAEAAAGIAMAACHHCRLADAGIAAGVDRSCGRGRNCRSASRQRAGRCGFALVERGFRRYCGFKGPTQRDRGHEQRAARPTTSQRRRSAGPATAGRPRSAGCSRAGAKRRGADGAGSAGSVRRGALARAGRLAGAALGQRGDEKTDRP
ncbi:MAG: uroporphyrinogen-III synthase [Rhodospirillales bacterium]